MIISAFWVRHDVLVESMFKTQNNNIPQNHTYYLVLNQEIPYTMNIRVT